MCGFTCWNCFFAVSLQVCVGGFPDVWTEPDVLSLHFYATLAVASYFLYKR